MPVQKRALAASHECDARNRRRYVVDFARKSNEIYFRLQKKRRMRVSGWTLADMTLIDFYVLQKHTPEDQHNFACRLIEKAVRQGNRVMLATRNEAQSRALDALLWSFRPDAFIPHGVHGDPHAATAPVLISHHDDDERHSDVLVNLKLEIPTQFSRFQRLAEIVIQETRVLDNSRQSYAYYKQRGYPINTHKI